MTPREKTTYVKKPAWLETFRPERVRDLDPRRHALIEASAGTGKTFAIEHLVLRLLVENPNWNPEEILLLSFTEKTVAELRDRIRRLLRAQVDDSDPGKRLEGWSVEDRERLKQVWLHADDLSVHTLHAFCQSALRRDPVAGNALIRAPLTEDAPLADVALDRLMRGRWARDPVRLARLTGALGIGAGTEWRKKLVRLTLKWQPWRFDTLDPDHDPGLVAVLEAEAEAAASALRSYFAAIDSGAFPVDAFRRSFDFTKTGKAAAKAEQTRRAHAYEKVFRFCEAGDFGTQGVLEFFRKGFTKGSKPVKNGWASEIPDAGAALGEWQNLAAHCARLRNLAESLEEARRIETLGLQAEAARELRAELDAEKLRRGLISYEDMPRNLVEALRRSPELAARLRRRYKACIVDEFQDTDPLQWEILEALCLGPEKNDAGTRITLPVLPLFLVGDPKQAIYSFRGGDLRTYMSARSRFRELASEGLAQGVGLDANFRSNASLIAVLNAVFAREEWFGPAPAIPLDPAWHLPGVSDDIVFTPVHAGLAPGAAQAGPVVRLRDFSTVGTDPKGGPAWPAKSSIEREVREWIASRIAAAIHEGARPGDFAVLTRSNPEGEAVARRLRQRGVPCRIRRRNGPWSGPAADALRLLLEWIDEAASPDAQARILLLPFIPRALTSLAEGEDRRIPGARPDQCPPLIARWAALAGAGRWPEFFTSLLEEGGIRERLAARSEEEAARFERLATLLSEAGAAPGTTTRALCERFDSMRRGEEAAGGDEGEDEESDGTVTVMTLHLSKGLEFRHVFVAATGTGRQDDFRVLRDAGARGFRIALDTEDAALRQQSEEESHAEDKRLHYVGFTRARDSLHVPILPAKFSRGTSGPLGGFVADALRGVADADPQGRSICFDADDLWPGRLPPKEPRGSNGPTEVVADRETWVRDSRKAFRRRRVVSSYSSLAKKAGEVRAPETENELLLDEAGLRMLRQEPEPEIPEEDTLTPVPSPTPASTTDEDFITAAELPPGAGAGTALHAILEHTDFASGLLASSPEEWLALPGMRERIEEALRRESVDASCAPAAARAVWNTLRMPLPDPAGGPDFRLADLAGNEDARHEVEFLLKLGSTPASEESSQDASEDSLPEEVVSRGDFLWGFIDLVFRRNGRYYLLDWKSNLLPSYDEASVKRSMADHHYDLQWKLYAVALHRWLEARLPGYEYASHFGGVHYVYLRGASLARFSGFSTRPTKAQVTGEFPKEIERLFYTTPPAGAVP